MAHQRSDEEKRSDVEKRRIHLEAREAIRKGTIDDGFPRLPQHSDVAYGRTEDLRQLAQVKRIADREAEAKEDAREQHHYHTQQQQQQQQQQQRHQQQLPQQQHQPRPLPEKRASAPQPINPNAMDAQSRQARHFLARQEPVPNNDWNQDVIFEKKKPKKGHNSSPPA